MAWVLALVLVLVLGVVLMLVLAPVLVLVLATLLVMVVLDAMAGQSPHALVSSSSLHYSTCTVSVLRPVEFDDPF